MAEIAIADISRVFKYQIPFPCDQFTLALGTRTIPLCVGAQYVNDMTGSGIEPTFHLWARVYDLDTPMTRVFRLAGTGHELEENVGRYIGTIHLAGFVWHVFEVNSPIPPLSLSLIDIQNTQMKVA